MISVAARGQVGWAAARLRLRFFVSAALVLNPLAQVLEGAGHLGRWSLWALLLPAIYTSSTPRRIAGDPRQVHDPDNVLASPGQNRTGSTDHG